MHIKKDKLKAGELKGGRPVTVAKGVVIYDKKGRTDEQVKSDYIESLKIKSNFP